MVHLQQSSRAILPLASLSSRTLVLVLTLVSALYRVLLFSLSLVLFPSQVKVRNPFMLLSQVLVLSRGSVLRVGLRLEPIRPMCNLKPQPRQTTMRKDSLNLEFNLRLSQEPCPTTMRTGSLNLVCSLNLSRRHIPDSSP